MALHGILGVFATEIFEISHLNGISHTCLIFLVVEFEIGCGLVNVAFGFFVWFMLVFLRVSMGEILCYLSALFLFI